jgi:hypothetical protein
MSKAMSRGKWFLRKAAFALARYSARRGAGAKSAAVFRGARDPAILGIPSGLQRVVTVSTPETSDTHFFHSFGIVLGLLIVFTILLFGFARVLGKNQNVEQLEDPLVKNASGHNAAAH